MRRILFLVLVCAAFGVRGQLMFEKKYGGSFRCGQATFEGGCIMAGSNDSGFYFVRAKAYGDTAWTKTYRFTYGYLLYDIIQTRDSGYIACGMIGGTNSAGIIKLDTLGNIQWQRTYSYTGLEGAGAFSIIQTVAGEYLFVGDNGSFATYGMLGMKVDLNGNTASWWGHCPNINSTHGYSVKQTVDGGFVYFGTASYGGQPFLFLARTTSSNTTIWCNTYGGSGIQYFANCVIQTSDGGFAVSGTRNGEILLMKLSSNGNLVWANTFGSGYANDLKQTSDGGFIIGGTYLIKTDINGSLVWAKSYPGTGSCVSVDIASDGGFLMTMSSGFLVKTNSFGNNFCNQIDVGLASAVPAISVSNASVTDAGILPLSPVSYTSYDLGYDSTVCFYQCTFSLTASQDSAILCNGNSTSATASPSGGTPPYTYSWNTGDTTATATNLGVGIYTVTVYDSLGCSATSTVNITQPDELLDNVSVLNNVSCFGGNDGAACITMTGGTPPFAYSWGSSGCTTATCSGLSAGAYVVTVTDSNACIINDFVNITEPTALTVTICSQTNLRCFGDSTGCVTACASGGVPPYTYIWSTNDMGDTLCNLHAGLYSVTVYDANGCTADAAASITQPAQLTSPVDTGHTSCYGTNDGYAFVNPSGGAPPYTYLWSPTGQTVAFVNNLTAGNYTVTITDMNGCTILRYATVIQPAQILPNLIASDASCSTCNDGSCAAYPTGPYSQYYYTWSTTPAQYGQTATNLLPGIYTCCVSNVDGCHTCATDTVSYPTSIATNTATDGISIHPNPFTNQLVVTISRRPETGVRNQVVVTDVLGKEILRREFSGDEIVIDTGDLAGGFYLLRVGGRNYKIVKN